MCLQYIKIEKKACPVKQEKFFYFKINELRHFPEKSVLNEEQPSHLMLRNVSH